MEDALPAVEPPESDPADDSESAAADDSEPVMQTRCKNSTFRYEIKPNGMKRLHESVKNLTNVKNLNLNLSRDLLILRLIQNLPRPIPADRLNLWEPQWKGFWNRNISTRQQVHDELHQLHPLFM
jgi:hypothetical protein